MSPDRLDLEYDPDRGAYFFDPPPDAPVSTLAILAVSEVAGVDPLSLRPQFYTYDPERIDEIHRMRSLDWLTIDCEVELCIAGHSVVIEPDGRLRIDELA